MRTSSLFLCLLAVAAGAQGALITITEQITDSGFLDGTSFTNALVTVTLQGDTNNVTSSLGIFSVIGTASVNVVGLSSDTLTGTLSAYSDTLFESGGIETATTVVLATDDAAFGTYDMNTSIGPLVGQAFIANPSDVPTAGGTFGLDATTNQSTFTATVAGSSVPEPGSMVLLGAGIAAIWRKRRS
jgi:hypothetical protein